ncbi:MAG: phosphonopyruvate decarboxylase [Spirochaetes bacterium]|jgi:phosphonopyruvate decarboxylase|nr:phosphonopyruvate decarboxylase [Spirochaetota bacterium]
MKIEELLDLIHENGIDFFTGVPDSQLKALCDTLYSKYGTTEKHVVAANEGAAVALAAGHYLATGKPALVYMQNSGIGNAVNPICSLINDKVYAIPVLFIIGWRGKPGTHDEPQHIFQGEITTSLLDLLDIETHILTDKTTTEELAAMNNSIKKTLANGRSAAFVVEKNALQTDAKTDFKNGYPISRERAVEVITRNTDNSDVFVSTTGKLSRELYEIREAANEGHEKDFLTVGSMGHSIMIACGIAAQKKERRVFCLDGDGAVLMHTGSLAVCGSHAYPNLVHIVLNNGAHESVGGMPTAAEAIDLLSIAGGCGYKQTYSVQNENDLINTLEKIKTVEGPIFIEVKINIESRGDLSRPTSTPQQNKQAFMEHLKN